MSAAVVGPGAGVGSNAPASPSRVASLDRYRFVAVTLALLSHVVLNFTGDLGTGDLDLVRKAITRAATPTLIVLFGVMLELVYVRKFVQARDAGRPALESTASAAFKRAAFCYAAFVFLAALGFVAGRNSAVHLGGAVVLIAPALFATIYKFYFFMLLALPLIVLARVRWGALAPLAATLFAVAWGAAIGGLPAAPFPLHHIVGFVTGIGDTFGPSLVHSLMLLSAGMLCGSVFYGRADRVRTRRRDAVVLALLLAAAVAVIAQQVAAVGAHGFAERMVDINAYRRQNHPAYYAYGTLFSLALMGVATVWSKLGRARVFDFVGRHTFAYFLIGNAVILAAPHVPLSGVRLVVAGVACLALAIAGTFLWVRVGRESALWQRLDRRVGRIARRLAAKASSLFSGGQPVFPHGRG
ncbi:hypothetical protein [Luteimonas abyssi]|uniref:hypothetical protein n=1 Tax=Luteimonas abyssi TaxID=1247514 RepID=UPI000737B0D7|nr:hypothetical protein [Luteimonas abyssi]